MLSYLSWLCLTSTVLSVAHALSLARRKKPHIIYILADDLGYASVGFNSPSDVPAEEKPKTPEIDRLRREGAGLSRFYTFKFCSPTRSSFISGRLPIHVNQNNIEVNKVGGGIPIGMTTIAEVLGRGGYRCHVVGKWHCGASDPRHLPVNRGFASSFGLLGGRHGHYNQRVGGFVDLWRNDRPATGETGTYTGYLYTAEAVRLITEHDTREPFFLFMSYTEVHTPEEVPDKYWKLYHDGMIETKRYELAMISCMDEGISNITTALKDRGMYDDSLIIFSSDNGGRGNNYPLRGNKGNLLEGGVRVVAFVSGGFLPSSMRGGSIDAYMHIVDLYATFASFAGEDPRDDAGEDLGFPPIDSFDMSDAIMGVNATSPRDEIPLATLRPGEHNPSALIWLRGGKAWKLIHGMEHHPVFHTPEGYLEKEWTFDLDNGSEPFGLWEHKLSKTDEVYMDCTAGCLFDVEGDPHETKDVANEHPSQVKKMLKRSRELDSTCYQSKYGRKKSTGGKIPEARGEHFATRVYGGHWGPFVNLKMKEAKSGDAGFLVREEEMHEIESYSSEDIELLGPCH